MHTSSAMHAELSNSATAGHIARMARGITLLTMGLGKGIHFTKIGGTTRGATHTPVS